MLNKKWVYMASALILSTSLASAYALADGPGGGPGGPDGGPPPIERRGGPGVGDHFAYQGHRFERGHPMPQEFRRDDYQVNDWHDRGLPPPPDGQDWAYIDGNYVLIAAATGVITSIILNGGHP